MEAFAQLIILIAELYSLLILGRVLMSWVNLDPYSPLGKTLYQLTEPVLEPIRNLLPPSGMFDFSPIVAIIGIQVFATIIATILTS